MSMASKPTQLSRSVRRIISIPLISSSAPTSSSSASNNARNSLTYYHFQIHQPPPQASEKAEDSKSKSRWLPEEGVLKWAQNKAARTWAGFGQADEGTWKIKVFRAGEMIVDRIDFEELSLKTVDPSLGPKLTQLASRTRTEKADPEDEEPVRIPLHFPPSLQDGESSLSQLRALVDHRAPKHRKGFWIWLLVSPLTAPFALIPVIPNLPFFFCVWRSWSHYRAYRASEYLSRLIQCGIIVPEKSLILDQIYTDYKPASSTASFASEGSTAKPAEAHSAANEEQSLLLSRSAVPALISAFNLKNTTESDMYRALEQARMRSGKR